MSAVAPEVLATSHRVLGELRHLAAVWVEGLLDMVAHYPAGAGR
jgi:hypothetical protein